MRAVGLGKCYRIGPHEAYHTLREAMVGRIRHPFAPRVQREVLWALRDVSFEIPHGSVVGLVGRNGAGKTTLLRLLARITRPTEGRAELRGSVASLLEVGTAFHPELTGRENIRMGAAVLGMRRADLSRLFDAIVDFAGVERFLDTPLKRYSTGMQMRLAFAVAAHLEPDLLLIDEVLAVGDLEFQRRCLGRMEDAVHAGRTIVLASHQMHQLRRLCTTCLWIDQGRVRAYGPTAEILASFEASMLDVVPPTRNGERSVDAISCKLLDATSDTTHVLHHGGQVTVAVDIHVPVPIDHGEYGITLYDQTRQPMWSLSVESLRLAAGFHRIVHRIDGLPLRPGAYTWHPGLFDGHRWQTWWLAPDLLIDAPFATHQRRDEYAGMLNVQGSVEILSTSVEEQLTDRSTANGKEKLFAPS